MIPDEFSHALLITGSRSWADEPAMRAAFNELWTMWGPSAVTRPVLLSGGCPSGADALAEQLWSRAGFTVQVFTADWQAHGRVAGPRRNQAMVDHAIHLSSTGTRVAAMAFLEQCSRAGCPRRQQEQLIHEGLPGHWSHGTLDCRSRAVTAGLDSIDVLTDGPRS